jgi:DNA-binding ferritin-like protein
MALEDTAELRDQLSEAWDTLTERLIESGHPAPAVIETMFDSAAARFASLNGNTATANYLRLLAEQLQASEKDVAHSLISG